MTMLTSEPVVRSLTLPMLTINLYTLLMMQCKNGLKTMVGMRMEIN